MTDAQKIHKELIRAIWGIANLDNLVVDLINRYDDDDELDFEFVKDKLNDISVRICEARSVCIEALDNQNKEG